MSLIQFSDRILNQIQTEKNLQRLRDWIAESQSWYSAPEVLVSKEWLPHVLNARQALAAIFAAKFLPYWVNDEIFKRIGQLAYLNRYQGTWKIVQDILERIYEDNTGTEIDEKIWLSYQSEDDFFGNFLVEVNCLLKINYHSWKRLDERKLPKKKVRRRGYQDKGSLRPSHKRGRNLPEPEPGEDRRELVRHPLLYFQREGDGGDSHPPNLQERR